MSTWIRPDIISAGGGVRCIFDEGDVGAGWYLDTSRVSDGDLGFHVWWQTDLERRSTGGLLAVGEWAHVVATYDGSHLATNIHLYLNGAETSYGSATDGVGERVDDSPYAAYIDCNNGGNFAGLIDDVRLYNRVLSPTEVSQL